MRKLAVMLLAVVTLGSVPVHAKQSKTPEARAAEKRAKQQQKEMKKFIKAQKKALKKAQQQERKRELPVR